MPGATPTGRPGRSPTSLPPARPPVVSLPASLEPLLARTTSDGRVWRSGLDGLRRLGVRIRFREPARRGLPWRRPEVWLSAGHTGPLGRPEPVVALLHEAPWAEPDEVHCLEPAFRDSVAALTAAAVAEAAVVVTPSESARRQVIEAHAVPGGQVAVVPYGVDTSVFTPAGAAQGRALVRAAGLERPYVLFVSNVHPRKNLPVLRAAVELLVEGGGDHGLVMVLSPAPDRLDSAALDEAASAPLAGRPDRVAVLRSLAEADLAAVMAGADVLCAPSRSEGFGFAPLEAMACGTPVVVSDRASLPEVVGPAGLVVEPEPEALAAALTRVLGDALLAEEMRRRGLERARRYTWEATAAGWLDALAAAGRR